jgi:hypothetical protein
MYIQEKIDKAIEIDNFEPIKDDINIIISHYLQFAEGLGSHFERNRRDQKILDNMIEECQFVIARCHSLKNKSSNDSKLIPQINTMVETYKYLIDASSEIENKDISFGTIQNLKQYYINLAEEIRKQIITQKAILSCTKEELDLLFNLQGE